MKRALITAGLLLTLAIAAGAPCAQPAVAALEVTKGSKQALSQHERIERGIAEILQILKGSPPPRPVDPLPPTPIEPAPTGDNPFVAWCASGGTVVEYVMLRNGGVWLSPAQEAQAQAAGCFAAKPSPPDGGGTSGPTTGAGFDLGEGDGLVKVNPVSAGQAITLAFTVRPGARRVVLHVFGAPGAFFRVVTDAIDGADVITLAGSGQLHQREVSGISPGRHTYTVSVDGSGQLGVRLEQQ